MLEGGLTKAKLQLLSLIPCTETGLTKANLGFVVVVVVAVVVVVVVAIVVVVAVVVVVCLMVDLVGWRTVLIG